MTKEKLEKNLAHTRHHYATQLYKGYVWISNCQKEWNDGGDVLYMHKLPAYKMGKDGEVLKGMFPAFRPVDAVRELIQSE